MEVNQPSWVTIALVRADGQSVLPTLGPGREKSVATPKPVTAGTPGAALAEAFGGDFEAYGLARLVGGDLRIDSVWQDYQPLDQPKVSFPFSVTGRTAGRQELMAVVSIQWRNRATGQVVKGPIQVWESRIEIDVQKPWIALDDLNLASTTCSVIGSSLSLPWIVQRARGLRLFRRSSAT